MFKKLAIAILSVLAVALAAAAVGCGKNVNYDEKYSDRVKIVFELEGGKYLNSETNVTHYYSFAENAAHLITPLEDKKFSEDGVTKGGGFVLEGWYRTKTVENGQTVYSDKWNFETDVVPAEGLTLYAKWKSPIIYTFRFVYMDGDVEKQVNELEVNEGNKLADVHTGDVLTYANKLTGRTAIAVYYDKEHKQPFDDSVAHPGGDVSTAINLYVEFIEGSYEIVKTKSKLNLSKSKNIYLLADIDMEGAELCFDNFSGKHFIGNGHKIYNFTVKKDWMGVRGELEDDIIDESERALTLAIFKNLTDAQIENVTFEDVTITVDTFLSDIARIYVAPLAVRAENCTFDNVKVVATFAYKQTPFADDEIGERLIFVTDKGSYVGTATESGCVYEITNAGKIQK